MREVIAVVAMMALAAGAGYAARDMQRPEADGDGQTCLPNADWMCADVRMDGFSLPLEPYCVEYVHKSRALPKAKAGDGE